MEEIRGMKDKSYLFEAAVTELTMNVLDSGEGFLAGEGEYPLPGRLAVLAEGFAQEMDLEQVNERLKEEGFESLYARSLYEAGLIYAFSHGLSYEEWKKLYHDYMERYRGKIDPSKQIFPGGKITLKQLEAYVRDNSSSDGLETEMLTLFMETGIVESKNDEDFYRFMDQNVENFSAVREKHDIISANIWIFTYGRNVKIIMKAGETFERMLRQYGSALIKMSVLSGAAGSLRS